MPRRCPQGEVRNHCSRLPESRYRIDLITVGMEQVCFERCVSVVRLCGALGLGAGDFPRSFSISTVRSEALPKNRIGCQRPSH